jgi:hypothetical protein
LAAIIHVKLSGEGDFGPVDLECAIPPARLPVVMAALFGQPMAAGAAVSGGAVKSSAPGVALRGDAGVNDPSGFARQSAGMQSPMQTGVVAQAGHDGKLQTFEGQGASAPSEMISEGAGFAPASLVASGAVEPGLFITHFVGNLGDLIARLQPRGFAETILIAAIWLHYRDSRSFVTRDDVRRILRRQDHLRMPRNFSRDFHAAIARGYLEAVESEDGFAVSSAGYQWFRSECTK